MPFQHVFIGSIRSAYGNARHGVRTRIAKLPSSRRLSSFAVRDRQFTRTRTEKLPQAQTRTFATTRAQNSQREIAVLGGGITGLTAAHYLARHAKNAHITLYEGSKRLGGWIHGEKLRVGSGKDDEILFQRGPRMLRPYNKSLKFDDLVLYDVVGNLDMGLYFIEQNRRSSRYIYYPDHLVRLPIPEVSLSNLFATVESYLREPIWDGALMSGIRLAVTRNGHEGNTDYRALAQDESIGDYFDRVFGDDRVTKNIMSAVIHGIYGGDVYKLSAKHSIFDHMWRGSKGPTDREETRKWVETKDIILFCDMAHSGRGRTMGFLDKARDFDLIAYDDGLLTLVNSLVKDLKAHKNVTIKPGHFVTSLAYEDGKVSVKTKQNPPKQFNQVISTLFSKHLASLVQPAGCLPSLEETQAVTIMVVNMWFPNPYILANNHGFGYLIPSSTPNNDECLLGVLFDSDAQLAPDPIPGTKLTVMMGGHYWDGWKHLPTEEMAEAMAKEAVFRHLNIDPSEPVFTSARLCRDCLPQYTVGHKQRMADAHKDLMRTFKGRLSVAGHSYTGIGVLPSMRAGFDVAMSVALGHGPPWSADRFVPPDLRGAQIDHVGMTGLLGFTAPEKLTLALAEKELLWGKRWQTGFGRYGSREEWERAKEESRVRRRLEREKEREREEGGKGE
ncbi:Protoporphyrinogen oxidase [Annulohypoxylon truncatum]|uniref:Protoporphyrinogen oxidase n=1 Tax=Annulohypoxylon truncatum TaxID=327061 RepID=UPI002008D358|nr:Protoporphyrinogen oxidase [Annulohypoxylon truncatum]KAI1213776.1 Protoporphyrinogen oxidase [Annulohypoxylon truncatum]